MPHTHPAEVNLHEDANVRLTIKGVIGLICTCIICAATVVGYQIKTDYRITELQSTSLHQHQEVMTKLAEIDNRQQLYVLKQNMEDLQVWITRRRDMISGTTNAMTPAEELDLRKQIRYFLAK